MKVKAFIILGAMGLLFSCTSSERRSDGDEGGDGQSSEVKKEESADKDDEEDEVEGDEGSEEIKAEAGVPEGAAILMKCYPSFVKGYKDGKLLLSDGSEMVYDDQREKSFEEKLDDADPEDMFAFVYNLKSPTPEYLQDAGRSRCEQLFKKMYGASSDEVKKNLVNVDWFGQTVQFTKVNGADEHLKAVEAELKQHPEFNKYFRSEGTFYWRPVRGAKRLSAHSYGMTIDIGGDFKTYWLWANPDAGETTRNIKYQNKMPMEIVKIFEKHGFIWGGRWYHYDTMHFEYRPEILMGCSKK